eukprot:scaffold88561_cov13-Tisochrysis_lutea.AAC.1
MGRRDEGSVDNRNAAVRGKEGGMRCARECSSRSLERGQDRGDNGHDCVCSRRGAGEKGGGRWLCEGTSAWCGT